MNISSNLNSMIAHQTMLNNSANNIANVNTDNYQRIDTEIVSAPSGSPIAMETRLESPGILPDLIDQKVARLAFELNAKVIQTSSEIDKNLMDTLDKSPRD